MARKSLRRIALRLLAAAVALAALPLPAAAMRSVAETAPRPSEAQYQRLVEATNAVMARLAAGK